MVVQPLVEPDVEVQPLAEHFVKETPKIFTEFNTILNTDNNTNNKNISYLEKMSNNIFSFNTNINKFRQNMNMKMKIKMNMNMRMNMKMI